MVIVKLVSIVLVFSAVWFSGPSTCCWRSRRGDHWLARPKTSMVSWYRPAFCWYNFFLYLLSLVVEEVECLHPLLPNWNHSLLKWSTKCHCQMEVFFLGSFSSTYSFLWWIWGNLGIGISSLHTGWLILSHQLCCEDCLKQPGRKQILLLFDDHLLLIQAQWSFPLLNFFPLECDDRK